MTTKQSILYTIGWTFLAMIFAGYIFVTHGADKASQFVTVFTIEKMLSMDNLLVMFMIFKYFNLTPPEQKDALTFGLIGAFTFRTGLIYFGTDTVNNISWVLYLFAAFLIYAGVSIMFEKDGDYNPEDSRIVSFFKKRAGNMGTFLACVCAIEISDILFAVDSIPASLGVSQNMFVILSANIFAVLGLRSLYHAVANGISILHGIERYIGAVLVLVGAAVFSNHFWAHIPEWALLGTVITVLGTGTYRSLTKE